MKHSECRIGGLFHRYKDAIEKSERLCRTLARLTYEGKVHFGRNLRETRDVLRWIECETAYQMKMEEEILFPFLKIHVPKLEGIISLLTAEHGMVRQKRLQLRQMLGKLENTRSIFFKSRWIASIKADGIWLVYLLRCHMESESQSIYFSLDRDLHPQEIHELEKRLDIWIKRNPYRCLSLFTKIKGRSDECLV